VKTCGQCKWWGRVDHRGYGYGKTPEGMDWCGRVTDMNGDDDYATLEDASDYYAALKTREAFGCVLWEVKT